jgi:hypothetical protein
MPFKFEALPLGCAPLRTYKLTARKKSNNAVVSSIPWLTADQNTLTPSLRVSATDPGHAED